MKIPEEVQKYLSEIEKSLADFDCSVNRLSEDLDALKLKQKKISESFRALIKLYLSNSENKEQQTEEQINSTPEDMAREITKEDKKVIQLKNGQVSMPFEEKMNLADFNIPEKLPVEFNGIEQISWNAEESKFEGTPKRSGEFAGKLLYWLTADDMLDGKPALEKEVHFLVNPDPRSLWQNIDPPENGPYYKKNTDYSVYQCRNRTIVGASVRGKSHAHKGSFRDDHLLIKSFENIGWTLQVVADGAGSAEFSRQGSKIACETTSDAISLFMESAELQKLEDLLAKRFQQQDKSIDKELEQLIYQISVGTAYKGHLDIKKFAGEEGLSEKSFATTLLFALSKEFNFGTVVISFSVGDGAIGVMQETDTKLTINPDGGEFSGQTCFLTMPEIFKPKNPEDIKRRYSIHCFTENITSIILMTDGISDPKFGTENNLRNTEYWNKLWKELKPILLDEKSQTKELLLKWSDFYIPGEYDDRTISILF